MPYYKDLNNKLHWLDSEEFSHMLPSGSTILTDSEASDLITAQTALSPRDTILSQIWELESTITPRRMREAVLGIDNGWLSNIENQITQLRLQL